MYIIEELDYVELVNGRKATILLKHTKPRIAYEIECEGEFGVTQTIEPVEVQSIIRKHNQTSLNTHNTIMQLFGFPDSISVEAVESHSSMDLLLSSLEVVSQVVLSQDDRSAIVKITTTDNKISVQHYPVIEILLAGILEVPLGSFKFKIDRDKHDLHSFLITTKFIK